MNQKNIAKNPTFRLRSALSYPIPQIIVTFLRLSLSLLGILPQQTRLSLATSHTHLSLPPCSEPEIRKKPTLHPRPFLPVLFAFPACPLDPSFLCFQFLLHALAAHSNASHLRKHWGMGLFVFFFRFIKVQLTKLHIFKVHKMTWYTCTL